MATLVEPDRTAGRSLPEALARTLRHEVGDLLQTVYAAVAILQRRLPTEATVERRILADLRSRAQGCKQLLDHVSDLVSPLSLSIEKVDLAQLAVALVAAASSRYPKLEVRANSSAPVPVPVDEKRISQVGELLLTQACEAAVSRVWFHTRAENTNGEVEWAVADDRPEDAGAAELDEFFRPLDTLRPGSSGIQLALAQRLVQLHGGRITVARRPQGGFCVHVWLPTKAPASAVP